jgi:hypothetical protein
VKTDLIFFCKKCGDYYTIVDGVESGSPCPWCGTILQRDEPYLVPVMVDGEKFGVPPEEVRELLENGNAALVVAGELPFTLNIKIDGEWNGMEIGHKIREKNDQLKRKWAGYSHEQKNLRAHTEQQVAQRQQQDRI